VPVLFAGGSTTNFPVKVGKIHDSGDAKCMEQNQNCKHKWPFKHKVIAEKPEKSKHK
jgi:hypothetical protein